MLSRLWDSPFTKNGSFARRTHDRLQHNPDLHEFLFDFLRFQRMKIRHPQPRLSFFSTLTCSHGLSHSADTAIAFAAERTCSDVSTRVDHSVSSFDPCATTVLVIWMGIRG